MKLKEICPTCNKTLITTAEFEHPDAYVRFYKCGHWHTEKRIQWPSNGQLELQSLDGSREARPYQVDAINFGYKTDVNFLLTDQVGLGKTATACFIYRNAKQHLGKCLIVVKSSTLYQWVAQYKLWANNNLLGCFIIQGTKGIIPQGFDTYIISMDTFGRMVKVKSKENSMWDYSTMMVTGDKIAAANTVICINPQLREALGDSPCLIVDECQSFKDPISNRTKALVGFIKEMNVKHKIFLSATPVKNKADEFFVSLNLLRPDLFPSLDRFRRDWLVKEGVKWTRVNEYRLNDFREMLSDFVLRRETKDVLPDLPPFRREFEIINIEDETLKDLYNKEVKKLEQKYAEAGGNVKWMDVQVNMMALRRITGIAKIDFACQYIDTFLDTSETEKIAIGIWHQDVRDILYNKLLEKGFNPLKMSGEDSAQEKLEIVKEFQKPERRIIIINMIAGGVGIDGLECCNNIVGLERAWNSVDEEQFEGRFAGARQAQSHLPVYAEYWIAKGTLDEDFHDMIQHKKEIVHEVTDNNWDVAADTRFLKELVQKTIGRRL